MNENEFPVAIIGGGPVGLAAAAHLLKRNLPFILFEKGSSVGKNILDWGHINVFSPWKYNIDKAAEELLLQEDWKSPDKNSVHSGKQFYDLYLAPLTKHRSISPFIHVNSEVIAIGRRNMDRMKTKDREQQPFMLQVRQGGIIKNYMARAVIDASGTWQYGNPVGSGGIFAAGELENSSRIFYGIPDVLGKLKHRYKNKTVLVVGGGHSAINTILELDKLKTDFPGTMIHWMLRKHRIQEVYGGQEADALPARGALGIKIEQLVTKGRVSVYTPFYVHEIRSDNGLMDLVGTQYNDKKALMGIEEVVSNTGSRPDFSFLRELRVSVDETVESVPALADLIDPNMHSCGTVRAHGEAELRQPEKDFYIVGMKSYGRAPTFLMATGYEQVRSIVAALAGDWDAARRVELDLPETGVCSSNGAVACCEPEIEVLTT
jgi:thioredoxin reductase